MFKNQPFVVKLQLIFLPLIILPLFIMATAIFATIPGLLFESKDELLQVKLQQAYQQLQEGHRILVTTGIENDPYFRKARIGRIVADLQISELPEGRYVLYSFESRSFLIPPSHPGAYASLIESGTETLDQASSRALRISISSPDRELILYRYFNPWNLLLTIEVQERQLYRPISNLILIFILILVSVSGFSIFLINRVSQNLGRPISELLQTVVEFGDGNFQRRIEPEGRDEIAVLGASFNTMADRITNFARDLEARVEQRTIELRENLEKLKRTQNQLIESEKLASLGSVVSGVAHEINTPLGVGITSASFLEHQLKNMEKLYQSDNLTKTDLENILRHSRESITILLENLDRAQGLVQSFKEVSADQLVDELRTFNFHTYLKEILSSLQNQVKRQVGEVLITGPEDIHITSYPGAYWQIFSNLVQNSLTHAFPAGFQGSPEISIQYEVEDRDLNIVYSDNGVGMERHILEKAFEPFVTTRRGKGGTGLGLNIVFNIVQRMKGSISLESGRDGSSHFIHIPGIVELSSEEEQE